MPAMLWHCNSGRRTFLEVSHGTNLETLRMTLLTFSDNMYMRISRHISAHMLSVPQPISGIVDEEIGNATRPRSTIATGCVLTAVRRNSIRKLDFSSISSINTGRVVVKSPNRDS